VSSHLPIAARRIPVLVSNALIGLREGLEAALVVVILAAFLVKTNRRYALRYVWAGVAAAVVVSVALGAVLTYGTSRLSFEQQELIGGVASIVAVGFVTAMVFWMRTAARTISGELKGRLDKALDVGPWAIALVGFLGVGREGLETAIFFYATTEAAGQGEIQPMLGWIIGLGGAVLLGIGIYRGAVKINLGKFFRYTGILLIVVAAGILAYGIHDCRRLASCPASTTSPSTSARPSRRTRGTARCSRASSTSARTRRGCRRSPGCSTSESS
jgi:high-affinity iron transporter